MKKTAFVLFVGLALLQPAFAQKSKAFDAHSYFEDYKKSGDMSSLQKAKESIDAAAQHTETKDNPEIQVRRGMIYLAAYEALKEENVKKFSTITNEQEKALAVFENTPTNDLFVAYEAFKEGKRLDEKNKFSDELKNITTIATYLDYAGRARLNKKKYADALVNFEQAYEIGNKSDSTLLYYCAVSASYSNDNAKAKDYYSKMIANNPKERPAIYLTLANIDFALKDTVAALEVLKKGREMYPGYANIIVSEANYYIKKNRGEELLESLNKAIQLSPKEINLYTTRGNIYDRMATGIKGWEKDEALEKKRSEYSNLAEKDYLAGLAIDSTNFNLLFNIGALYYNQAAILNNKASMNADDIDVYNALFAQAKDKFTLAASKLEKAYAQKPGDENTKTVLKQIYFILKDVEKTKALEGK